MRRISDRSARALARRAPSAAAASLLPIRSPRRPRRVGERRKPDRTVSASGGTAVFPQALQRPSVHGATISAVPAFRRRPVRPLVRDPGERTRSRSPSPTVLAGRGCAGSPAASPARPDRPARRHPSAALPRSGSAPTGAPRHRSCRSGPEGRSSGMVVEPVATPAAILITALSLAGIGRDTPGPRRRTATAMAARRHPSGTLRPPDSGGPVGSGGRADPPAQDRLTRELRRWRRRPARPRWAARSCARRAPAPAPSGRAG